MEEFQDMTNHGVLRFKAQTDRRQARRLPAGSIDRRAPWGDPGLHDSEDMRASGRVTSASLDAAADKR